MTYALYYNKAYRPGILPKLHGQFQASNSASQNKNLDFLALENNIEKFYSTVIGLTVYLEIQMCLLLCTIHNNYVKIYTVKILSYENIQ